LAASLGDLFTYVCTSVQLGLAFPDLQLGVFAATQKFLLVFAVTQVPLALTDGWLTYLVLSRLRPGGPDEKVD